MDKILIPMWILLKISIFIVRLKESQKFYMKYKPMIKLWLSISKIKLLFYWRGQSTHIPSSTQQKLKSSHKSGLLEVCFSSKCSKETTFLIHIFVSTERQWFCRNSFKQMIWKLSSREKTLELTNILSMGFRQNKKFAWAKEDMMEGFMLDLTGGILIMSMSHFLNQS